MINIRIFFNKNKHIYGFKVMNHGSSYVCAAVSILTINTINCIEHFVKEPVQLDVDEEKAVISCIFPKIKNGTVSRDAALLLNTMLFGLKNIMLEHPDDICIKEVSE